MNTNSSTSLLKRILSKTPIFLFCILFIRMYSNLFGEANKIACVVVLTGILMFLKSDLNYNVKQSCLFIIILFIIIAISPKLSLYNPYLGLLIDLISIGFILIVACHDLTMDNQVTFLLGYIFCRGYDISGETYLLRFVALLLGGIIIAVLYYFTHRKTPNHRSIIDNFTTLSIRNHRTQWYLELTVTLSLVMFLGDLTHYPRTMWISLAVLSIMQPLDEHRSERMKYRFPATLIAAVFFYFVFVRFHGSDYQMIISLLIGFSSMLANSYFTRTIFNSFNAMIPAMLLFSSTDAIYLRIASNLFGVVVAIFADYLFGLLFRRISNTTKHNS